MRPDAFEENGQLVGFSVDLEAQNICQIARFYQPEPPYAALVAGEVEALVAPAPGCCILPSTSPASG
jgi:hypothetical protein